MPSRAGGDANRSSAAAASALSSRSVPGHAEIFRLALPIILANCSVPLLGLVDTAVIGHTGTAIDLGAIAFGSLIFSFVYWSFGFLRMGTTGFVARADGRGDEAEVRAAVTRALLLAVAIAALLVTAQRGIIAAALALLGGSGDVESITREYFMARIWGAPAALGSFALMGLFIGTARTGYILATQLFLNATNAALDVLFAGVMRWGAAGIALGTAVAEWLALVFGGVLAWSMLRERRRDAEPFLPWRRIVDRAGWIGTVRANADIMIRTSLLLFAFAWFTNQGAVFGDRVLAANHMLLQLISFSAFFLDGYAHAIEPLVGRAAGSGRLPLFDAAVRRSTQLAALNAAALSLLIWWFGDLAVWLLTDLEELRAMALRYLPWAATYVLLSFAAFQLDGIFIGTSHTRDMRNMSALAVAIFVLVCLPLAERAGNDGLWLAFVVFITVRALGLGARYPALRRSIALASGTADDRR